MFNDDISVTLLLWYFLRGFSSRKTLGPMKRRAELHMQKIFHANKNCLRKSVDVVSKICTKNVDALTLVLQQKQANRRVFLPKFTK
jgi:hypothetical protein